MNATDHQNIYPGPSGLSVAPFPTSEAAFLARLMSDARICHALHIRPIPDGEWRDVLAAQDPDEQNFFIARGADPAAWLRVNGLCGDGGAWISMLVVSPAQQRRGIGRYAVRFAEDFLRARGKRWAAIHTTADNTAACALYTACGYSLTDSRPAVWEDGDTVALLTFRKTL